MQKKLTKWKLSNYELELVFTTQEKEAAKKKALDNFRKDVEAPWFRKGHAPDDVVLQKVQPQYLEVATLESLIDGGLKEILDENKDIKFIWEPYDLDQKAEWDEIKVTMKLDLFPEVKEKNEDWKKLTMKKVEAKPTKEEIEDSFKNLQKNFADYKDAKEITKESVSKLTMEFFDKDWESVEKWSLFIWEPEFAEGKFFTENFIGKKKDEEVEFKYDAKKLPPTMHTRKTDKKAANVKLKVVDVKEVVLPKFTEENIKKFFGDSVDVKDEKWLKEYIKTEITKQKEDMELMKQVEDFLKDTMKSMSVQIPQTLIKQEQASRVKSLEQRFGSRENVENYFKQLWEEKTKEFMDDIAKSAKESLEKFFVLQTVCDKLKIKADFSKQMEVEKALHAKLCK